jgi:filamentous hemagglutinin
LDPPKAGSNIEYAKKEDKETEDHPANPVLLKDECLKELGIDAHAVKYNELGDKAKVARYDIYEDKATGDLWILRKGGKGSGINTGINIK